MLESGPQKERAILSESASFSLGERTSSVFVHATPEDPKEVKHIRKLVLVPGFAEYAEGALRTPVEEFARRGYDTYAFSEPASREDLSDAFLARERARLMRAALVRYRGAHWNDTFITNILTEESIPLHLFREAYVLITFVEEKVRASGSAESVDLVSHSKGTAAALIAALLRPDLFKKIIFANPISRFKSGTWTGMIRRFLINSALGEVIMRISRTTDEDSRALRAVAHDMQTYATERPERGLVFPFKWVPGEFWKYIGLPLPGGESEEQAKEMGDFDGTAFLVALGIFCPDIERITVYDTEDGTVPSSEIRKTLEEEGESRLGKHIETEHYGHYGLVKDRRMIGMLDAVLSSESSEGGRNR
jgi:pimeloyl-ACP methyl ester carboxylesterase